MEKQRLIYLLSRYSDGLLTAEENAELLQYSSSSESSEQFTRELEELMKSGDMELITDRKEWETLLEEVLSVDKPNNRDNNLPAVKPIRFFGRYWAAAAAILLLLGAGVYWTLFSYNKETSTNTSVSKSQSIAPGQDGAILTLADGTQIVLDSLSNGVVANQNGTLVQLKNGMLSYDASTASGTEIYNTMQTPRGRQFQLQLPDGSMVWLNAGSMIKFPAVFTGTQREVEVQGEAFFEITPMMNRPFMVKIPGKSFIKVLGTSFNVNAYANETNIYTTLFTGAINTGTTNGSRATLHPGQQAVISQSNQKLDVYNKNESALTKIAAWKNGYFNFEDLPLQEAMRQLERWYDIQIVYENGIPNISFWGKMERSLPLDTLLQMLKGARLNFRMEGRKLIVVNKP